MGREAMASMGREAMASMGREAMASMGREGDAPAEPELQSSAGASHSLCTPNKSIWQAFPDPIREDWTDPIAMQPSRKATIPCGPECIDLYSVYSFRFEPIRAFRLRGDLEFPPAPATPLELSCLSKNCLSLANPCCAVSANGSRLGSSHWPFL